MEAVTSGNVGMKKTRLVDILKESSNDREERGKNSSILPSSPRSMISKWFSSIRRSRESATLQSRLASTVTLSRNEGDGTEESVVESSGDKRTSVVASLTRVVPENDELDLRLKRNEQDKRRLKKVKCVKLPRPNFSKKAESADDPLSVAVHRTEEILMLSAVDTDERTGPILKNFDEKNSFQNSTSSCSKSTQTLMPPGFPGDPLFGFGFGVGLAFLLSYRSEYNKMVELQRQMEILLKDIKNEMRKRDVSACSRKPQPHSFVAFDSNIQYDQLSKLDSTSDSTRLHEINQLEAELETELEFLQLNLESESTAIPSQQCIEVAETSAAAENLSESFGEEDNHCGDVYSVCPYELERKLFELLQTRQEEHTEELEFALERTQSKLSEKEMEVSWWKENFHQHCPTSEESKYGGNDE
ncbi:uncharacterized protein [Aristolochia californica]|uniref:uncharacterized protein isoform X2 n=1 Tax=Aristolochia californica TaxID=171875 RepID=UPI0035DF7644